jgi:SAM-dependent methyltransferase
MQQGVHPDPAGFKTLENFSRASAFNHWLYKKITRFARGQILEVGSGIGNISGFLLRDQPAVSLSDLHPEYCQFLERQFGGHPHFQGVYELDLSLPDFKDRYPDLMEKFDTVIALNVIEHISNDTLAVRNAKSLLRDKGVLVILVPAGQWLYNSLDRELGHYKRYSKAGSRALLESAGLTVSDCRYFNAAAIFGWWFSGKILREKIISPAKLVLFNQLVPLFKFVDWFVTPFTGISVISAGTKI